MININIPCVADAPTGSSMYILSNIGIVKQVINPPIIPTIIDSQAQYKKHPPINKTQKLRICYSKLNNFILMYCFFLQPVMETNAPRIPFI